MDEYDQEFLEIAWAILVGFGGLMLAFAAGALLGAWAFFAVALVEVFVAAHAIARELRRRDGR